MASRKPKTTYHHGNLREALLDAAEALLPKHGAEGLTLREVARQAQVSHGAPYHHFPSREALLAAVAERGFVGLGQAMQSAKGATPRDRLVGICEAYVAFAARHPTRFRLMFGPLLASKALYPGLQQAGEQSFFLLLEASREVAPDEAMPLALAGWSMAHGLAHLRINKVFDSLPVPAPAAPELAGQLAQWLLRHAGRQGHP
ncbi:MAG TPA: TetR/AcrR family transcriptional regulator [Ideonella sp.]|uniref:TetR/AcrR family transcriptional regulator n=1 Tax=Ideonella sp. TaxID=1929293 RepID=UPI002BE8DF6C|nr:TetR/AcrR family transcriptional regulator [Ideonella sp.]HSI51454.1 TetR/AcrR family transcriptional regulator [Ideonella sp.]